MKFIYRLSIIIVHLITAHESSIEWRFFLKDADFPFRINQKMLRLGDYFT